MMAVAVIAAVSYLPPFTRSFAAFLGSAGFGRFIDEIGKFVTRDVDYFFQPAIAIIYITFVAMYLTFREIGQRPLDADEATLNAIEALKDASLGRLSEPDRHAAIARLDGTHATGDLAARIRGLLVDVSTIPAPDPTVVARIGGALRAWYQTFIGTRGFVVRPRATRRHPCDPGLRVPGRAARRRRRARRLDRGLGDGAFGDEVRAGAPSERAGSAVSAAPAPRAVS